MEEKERKQVREFVASKALETGGVDIKFQKYVNKLDINELEKFIVSGAPAGKKREYAEMVLNQKKTSENESKIFTRHQDTLSVANRANHIAIGALIISGISLLVATLK